MMWDILFGLLIIYILSKLFFIHQEQNMRGKIKVSRPYTDKEQIIFRAEKIDEMYYLWDNTTEDFLAQGSTLEKAFEVMIERFPDKVFKGVNTSTFCYDHIK